MQSLRCTGCAVVVLSLLMAGGALAAPWPAWRGANHDGTTSEKEFPLNWSPTNNVLWRVDLPGPGNSTPVVWSNTVVVSQATTRPSQRMLLAYESATGKVLWQTGTLWDDPEETHEDNPYCAASPVTDGERVIAYFGSAGVYAVNFEGAIEWRRDFGPQKHEWGYAASPVIHGNHVYVYHGPGPGAKLYALSRRTGKITWQVNLPEPVPTERTDGFKGRLPGVIGSFGSPVVMGSGADAQVVLGLPEALRSFAAETGKEVWSARGLNPLVYTSPVVAGDQVLIFGGFFGSSMAVRTGGSGDVTDTHRVWREERSKKNFLGSPVVKDGHVFLLTMEGFLDCREIATGRQLWEERLDGPGPENGSWSSPVLVGDRIYTMNKSGETFVVRASPKFEVLAVNSVGEPSHSSLALSDGRIFVRTWKGLWCIGKPTGLASR